MMVFRQPVATGLLGCRHPYSLQDVWLPGDIVGQHAGGLTSSSTSGARLPTYRFVV